MQLNNEDCGSFTVFVDVYDTERKQETWLQSKLWSASSLLNGNTDFAYVLQFSVGLFGQWVILFLINFYYP